MLPLSCDTMVALPQATKHRQTLFAKNSDRPKDECQPLLQRAREEHHAGSLADCEFIQVPEVGVTFRHIGSRPYWCRGYEHGFNEHQVVIGNEGLPSRVVHREPKLVGMELIRVGLERARTAAEAIDVMTGLIERYGQGKFENPLELGTYDNGNIVADPREAYVLEAAGHEWAVKRLDTTTPAVGISNIRSLTTDWTAVSPNAERHAIEQGWWHPDGRRFDVAAAYAHPVGWSSERTQGAAARRARSCAVLASRRGSIDLRTMMALLRDHSDGAQPEEPLRAAFERVPTGQTICAHYTESRGNTAASLVADLCADGSRLAVYWCSFYSPCLGVFFPVFVEGELPAVLGVGGRESSDASPWWLFRNLERAVRADVGGEAVDVVRRTWRELEEEHLETAYPLAARAQELLRDGMGEEASRALTRYMARNVERVLARARELLTTLVGRGAESRTDLVAAPAGERFEHS